MSIVKALFPRNKWGQGMLARWSALLILAAVFGWGAFSAFGIIYTYIGWTIHIPNPSIELPEEKIINQYDVQLEESEAKSIVNINDFDRDDSGLYLINEGDEYILAEDVGWDPVAKEQRNASGIPWAAAVALGVFLIFFWLSWRLVNGHKGSEVLLETEHELRKVVWPSKQRILNSSIVVVLTMVVISLILFFSDILINLMIRDVLRLW